MTSKLRERAKLTLAIAGIIFGFTGASKAIACSASIVKIGAVPVVDVDPFRDAAAKATLRVSVQIADPTGCALALSVAGMAPGAGRAMKFGGDHLIYRLFYRDRELVDDPNAFMPLEVDDDHPTFDIGIDVPAGQIGPAGLYYDPLTLRLVDLNTAQTQQGPEMSAVVSAAIDSRAQANIAGTATDFTSRFASATLDLGVLRRGSEGTAILQLRSTAPVTVKLTSQNGGLLQRLGKTPAAIKYELEFEGAPIQLSGTGAPLSRPASVSLAGTSYPVHVRVIEDPDMKPAGDYADLVTIEVTPD